MRSVAVYLCASWFVWQGTWAVADVAGRAQQENAIVEQLAQVELDLDASAGFFLHDTQSGEQIAYSADQRFPLNSTFKVFACAALLARVEAGLLSLQDHVDIRGRELESWSPGVEQWLDDGQHSASLDQLCGAMLALSDNTAANLVLEVIGGPEGFTAYMRSIGDTVSRLDRWEPELNEGLPGDLRDTTTPRAIASSLERLLLGDVLTEESRQKLREWLSGHVVADDLFRSALPADWSIFDRTGAGENGTRGIVAVFFPPGRAPVVAAMYLRDANVGLGERNAAIARVGHAIVQRFDVR